MLLGKLGDARQSDRSIVKRNVAQNGIRIGMFRSNGKKNVEGKRQNHHLCFGLTATRDNEPISAATPANRLAVQRKARMVKSVGYMVRGGNIFGDGKPPNAMKGRHDYQN